MPDRPAVVTAPGDGLWRVGRGDDPLKLPGRGATGLGDTRAGNRFDSFTGNYQVLYFGTDLRVCFGETLNRYRKDPRLAFIDDEWERREFMKRGTVPADWRSRRTAVRVAVPETARFFNVENGDNVIRLARELGPTVSLLGHHEIDTGLLHGPDRRVTRAISQWVWQQVDADGSCIFDGIRYRSRTNPAWECWAVFAESLDLDEVERQPILTAMPELTETADELDLVVF
jgi:hypothetical protein